MAQWDIPFDELAARAKQSIEKTVRLATLEMFARVVKRSPVDTGRFRANWNASYGSIREETSDATSDPSAEINAAVLSFPIGGVVYLSNSLPYAMTLEYGLFPASPKKGTKTSGGYSSQAPQGMVRITAEEFAYAVMEALAS